MATRKRLVVGSGWAAQVDLSPAEEAERDTEEAAAAQPIDYTARDADVLAAAMAQPGSALRALATLYFKDMNLIAGGGKPPTRTKAQFLAALRNEIR